MLALESLVACEQVDVILVQEPYGNNFSSYFRNYEIFSALETPKAFVACRSGMYDFFPLRLDTHLIALKVRSHFKEFILINIYRPPSSDISYFLDSINMIISDNPRIPLLVAGDFNAKHELWGGSIIDERGEAIVEFLMIHNLAVLNSNNSLPTFSGYRGESWIDLVITSHSLYPECTDWKVEDTISNSDHRYISYSFFGNCPKVVWKITKATQCKYDELVAADPWFNDVLVQSDDFIHGNDAVITVLYQRLHQYRTRCLKRITIKGRPVAWWSQELTQLRHEIRYKRRRYQSSRDTERRSFLKIDYYHHFARYKLAIRKAKEAFTQQLRGELLSRNPFARPYRERLDRIPRPTSIRPLLRLDNTFTDTMEESIKLILDHSFPRLEWVGPRLDYLDTASIAPLSMDDSMFIDSEVKRAYGRMDHSSAIGYDNINFRTVNVLIAKHLPFVTHVFNGCLQKGAYPSQWKIARVKFLLKPGRLPQKPDSYRVLSILPVLSRLFERLLFARLYHHVTLHNAVHTSQFGFRHGRSSVQAVYKLIEVIRVARVNKKTCSNPVLRHTECI